MGVDSTTHLPALDMILYDRPAGRDIIGHAIDTIESLRAERKLLQAGLAKWIAVSEDVPEAGKHVLATVKFYGHIDVIRASFVPKFSMEDDGTFQGDSDYDAVTDTYYWPPGWYEDNHCEETHWAVNGEVLAWMPLPEPFKEET